MTSSVRMASFRTPRAVWAVAGLIAVLVGLVTAAAPSLGEARIWASTGVLAFGLGIVLGPTRERWLILALLPATLLTGSALVPFEGRYVPAVAVMAALIVADRPTLQRLIERARALPPALLVALGVYLAWSIMTTVVSTNVPLSLIYTTGLALSLSVVFLVVAARADEALRRDVAVTCLAIALAMILSGWVLALLHGVEMFGRAVGLYFIVELKLLGSPTGIAFPQNYGPFVGPSTEPLALGTAAGIYLQARTRGRTRVLWAGAALLVFFALFATFSREGILMAAVASAAVVAYQIAKRAVDAVSVAIAALTAVTLLAAMTGGLDVIGRLDLTAQWYGKDGVAILLNPDYEDRGEIPVPSEGPGGPVPSEGPGGPVPGADPGGGGTSNGGTGTTEPPPPASIDLKGSSFHTRLTLWRASLEAVLDRPLVGYGLGTVADAIAPYLTGADARLRGVTPHSGYLRVAVELGLPGLLIQVVISLLAAWLAIIAIWRVGSPVRAVIAGFLAAILVHQVFGTVLFGGFSFGNFMFTLAVGLLATIGGEPDPVLEPG